MIHNQTDVAELVDALDLGPGNLCCESSSLCIRIYLVLLEITCSIEILC